MPVICPHCNRQFTIPQETWDRIEDGRGSHYGELCPHCQNYICFVCTYVRLGGNRPSTSSAERLPALKNPAYPF